MKAIVYERYGNPDVLRIAEVPEPVCGDGDILLRVRAVEATKADCEIRSFRFSVKWFWLPLRIAMGIRRPRRQILGSYFAGEVIAVGDAASDFTVGDEVFGAAGLDMGAYGERVALPAGHTIIPKPANMSFAEAAAVPLGGLNALHFMRLANIVAGESVLIIGAGGSIGLHAIQIAKWMGATVTAVDKTDKEEIVRRMGAVHFIDYTKTRFSDAGGKYDVVFDMVPRSSFSECMSVLTETGRYFTGNPRISVMLRCLVTNRFTRRTAKFAFARETREELEALRIRIVAGDIVPIVDEVLPMERAADAHRRVETESRLGAIVISMDA